MDDSFFAFLAEKDVEYKRNIPIRDFSSVRIGAEASVLAFPDTEEKLIAVVRYLENNGIKYRVVGKMTNILPSDEPYGGVLIFTLRLTGFSYSGTEVRAECGALLALVIARAACHSLGGAEPLSGIPGSVGGMVYSNAGAFGLQISDVFIGARVYDIASDSVLRLSNDDMRFSYRKSALSDKRYILLEASFRFIKKDGGDILREIGKIKEKRRCSQPYEFPSLGSVFKRAGEISAARLIDDCGLKGYSVGGAEISKKHAGFIVNKGGATSADFKSIIEHARQKVNEKYGIRLEEEIEFL